ncbi:uncharacterized protein LOC107304023 [Oryza brachyantha]|uniref:uncharacterized protein LOC107304023 n=1 Tax=Oryza brachyantha TaxID=4533 RepID=UPI001ADAD416|nr:uncharacterized protein LOC107304023 [Oryza brachyantha]
MWRVLSVFRRRRRRTARVVDESAAGRRVGADDGRGGAGALVARALLAVSCVARLDGGGGEEAWATSGWRPPGGDEVSHLMVVRESMRYAIYA